MKDIFRPHHQPAQLIYDAFQNEAKKRKGRKVDEWIDCELRAVLGVANSYAEEKGVPPLSLDQIKDVDMCAMGHVDYGAKLAYGVASLLELDRNHLNVSECA